jgi:type I restriction enzyme S subunit
MKAYPHYKDSEYDWIGNIPEHWKMVQLKFVAPRKTEQTEDVKGFGFQIALENIESKTGKIISSGSFEGLGNIFRKDDVLFNKLRPYLCKVVIAPNDGVAVSELLVLRPREDIDKRFLFYRLLESKFISVVDGSTYGAKMPRANWDYIGNLKIPTPPLPEQQAIADFLDRKTAQIDTLIEKKQRQIDLLHEQRTALINHAVTKGLNPKVKMKDSGVEWLGEIPSHWEMTTVRYFYDVKLGKMLDSNKQNGNDLVKPYLRAANIHWNKILLDEVGVNEMEFSESQLERYALQSGDLLVTEGGVTVGRSAIWNGELTECYFQNSLNRARPSKHASTKWLYYWMYFVTNNGFIDILADKSTFGHLTNEKLKALPIPIPPISEHDEIIEKLESYEPKMEAQIVLIEKQIAYLQEYRTALISEAVTGKIDVRTAE